MMNERRHPKRVGGCAWSVRLRHVFLPLIMAAALIPGVASDGSAQERPGAEAPSWEELRARPYPGWFVDAKLGIFIHWGVYSVPAYSGKEQYAEWFLRGLQEGDTLRTRYMREVYGEGFTYPDFAPLFRAELFEPTAWAHLFRRAGARYVVLVSKHHDGYALWPSRYAPDWNSVDVGPGRDLVGELTEAVRDAGLRMGLYYSLAEWNNPLHRWYTDPPDAIAPYVERHMIPQFKELISAYRPVVLFTDGEWSNSAEQWHARELIDWYFNTVGPDGVVNDRWGGGSDIGFRTPEYSAGIGVSDRPWAEVRGLGRSFALNRNEELEAYMTEAELVHRFARAVAAGGGMILNVGPAADGQIPLLQQERLLQLGSWLMVNGEAIYGSRPWHRTGEEREVTMERVDPTIDFDWVRNGPGRPISEDHFTAKWTGYLQPSESGDYTLEAEADDGVRVWIDHRLVIDRWGAAEEGTEAARDEAEAGQGAHGVVRLEAGRKVPIRVEYREEDLQASVRLFWSSPGQERTIIPRDRLFTAPDQDWGEGLRAVYRSQQQHVAYTTKNGDLFAILFDWPGSELAIPIPEPEPRTVIRLLGLDRELPWHYENGTLFVDFTGIAPEEVPGQWAWTLRLPLPPEDDAAHQECRSDAQIQGAYSDE